MTAAVHWGQVYPRSMGPLKSARMARPVRLEFAGALYHVTARGDRREAIFEDDVDRDQFLQVLGEVVERFHRQIESTGHPFPETPQPKSRDCPRSLADWPWQAVGHVFPARSTRFARHWSMRFVLYSPRVLVRNGSLVRERSQDTHNPDGLVSNVGCVVARAGEGEISGHPQSRRFGIQCGMRRRARRGSRPTGPRTVAANRMIRCAVEAFSAARHSG